MTATDTKRQYSTNIHIATLDFTYSNSSHKSNTRIFLPNKKYVVKVDYPFETGFELKFKTGDKGMTLRSFVVRLRNAYEKHYKKIEEDKIEDGYWHGIGDLFLEMTIVDDESGRVEIWIGS